MATVQLSPRNTGYGHQADFCDEQGYLKDPAKWHRKVGQQVAYRETGRDLTDEDWRIVEYIREYYSACGNWPLPARIARDLSIKRRHICRMAPDVWFKIAGLPNPRGHVMWDGRALISAVAA